MISTQVAYTGLIRVEQIGEAAGVGLTLLLGREQKITLTVQKLDYD